MAHIELQEKIEALDDSLAKHKQLVKKLQKVSSDYLGTIGTFNHMAEEDGDQNSIPQELTVAQTQEFIKALERLKTEKMAGDAELINTLEATIIVE